MLMTMKALTEGMRAICVTAGNAMDFATYSDDADGPIARGMQATIRSTEQWGQFKTPTLRNVALSPPYTHEGQMPDLAAVVRHYSTLEGAVLPGHHREQLLVPLGLSDAEQADLVAFLESLTGAAPDPALITPPVRKGPVAAPDPS